MTAKHFAAIVALALAAGAVWAAKKEQGPAPAGCYYGPRGGLHCARYIKAPGQESATAKERRLKRECKNLPNAGACLGYGYGS